MNKTDDDICTELDRAILAGVSQAEAARRLWLDGIKYRQQQREGKSPSPTDFASQQSE